MGVVDTLCLVLYTKDIPTKGKKMDKRITEIEEAIVTWSRIWGYSMTEWSMNRAEAQIVKLTRQLKALKEEGA